jgi:hypothetical protein
MDAMIRFQGNLTGRFESLERILQQAFSALASYNVHLIEVIRALDHGR